MTPIIKDDRVLFLTQEGEFGVTGKLQLGDARIGVILWTDNKTDKTPITLTVDASPFSLHQSMNAETARLIANALLSAAGEADALGSQP